MDGNECTHPVRVHGLCARCGQEVAGKKTGLYTILHGNTNVLLSGKEAERINEENYKSLSEHKKMILLLDLDQTIIHTSMSKQFAAYFEELLSIPPAEGQAASEEEQIIRSIHRIRIDGYNYYVKERDHLQWFLKEAAEHFEIHVYTMGNKKYALEISEILDKKKALFGDRIVTRDDNFGSFDKDITRLFPKNSRNVVILDDRPDVWKFSRNLLPIRPFAFFRTGDVNSPERLKKLAEQGLDAAEDMLQTEERYSLAHNTPCTDAERRRVLCDKIREECVLSLTDSELPSVMGNLKEIHREFFSDGFYLTNAEGVRFILDRKKSIFKGCVAVFFLASFEAETYFSSLFSHYGGRVELFVTKKTTHVVIGYGGTFMGAKPHSRVKCVDVEWVHQSIFALSRKSEDEFACELGSHACTDHSDTSSEEGHSLGSLGDCDSLESDFESALWDTMQLG